MRALFLIISLLSVSAFAGLPCEKPLIENPPTTPQQLLSRLFPSQVVTIEPARPDVLELRTRLDSALLSWLTKRLSVLKPDQVTEVLRVMENIHWIENPDFNGVLLSDRQATMTLSRVFQQSLMGRLVIVHELEHLITWEAEGKIGNRRLQVYKDEIPSFRAEFDFIHQHLTKADIELLRRTSREARERARLAESSADAMLRMDRALEHNRQRIYQKEQELLADLEDVFADKVESVIIKQASRSTYVKFYVDLYRGDQSRAHWRYFFNRALKFFE